MSFYEDPQTDICHEIKAALCTFFLYPKNNYDKYLRMKSIMLQLSTIGVPLKLICNIIYAYNTTSNYSFPDLMETISLLFSIIGCMYAQFYFSNHLAAIQNMLSVVSDFTEFGKPPLADRVAQLAVKVLKYLQFYTTLAAGVYVAYGLLQIASCRKENELEKYTRTCGLTIPLMLPVDIRGGLLVVLILVDVWSLFVYSNTIVPAELCFLFIIEMIITRIQHLQKMLATLQHSTDIVRTRRMFKNCVKYHIKIISDIANLNRTFKDMVMTYILITSFIIGLLGYQVMMQRNSKAFLHMMGWIAGIFLLCFSGQHLESENSSLVEAFYNIDWTTKEFLPLRRDLVFCLIISQKDLNIEAGSIGVLSLEVFSDIMYKAYSYLAVIAQ